MVVMIPAGPAAAARGRFWSWATLIVEWELCKVNYRECLGDRMLADSWTALEEIYEH